MNNEADNVVEPYKLIFSAQLTAVTLGTDMVTWEYAFVEQTYDCAGNYTALDSPRAGTCVEVNNQLVAVPTYAQVRFRTIVGGEGLWEFQAGSGGGGGTTWVRILCINESTYGYPGLVQTYDSDAQTYSDADSMTTTITASTASGTQTVTPASMTGITDGTTFLLIDGNCDSQGVTVTATTGSTFTADFTNAAPSYVVTSITITDGGTGYASTPPTVTFGGPGSGAAGTAVLDVTGDFVVSVTMTNNGMDYTSAPTTFSDPGSGTTATGTANISGPATIYFGGIWVPMNPSEFTPVQNDVDEPVIYLARHEENSEDGLNVWLALAGVTVVITCTDGSGFTYVAGRLVSYTPAT